MKILTPPNMAVLYRSLRLARVDSLAIGVMGCFRFDATGRDALIPEQEMWPIVTRALGGDAVLDEGYPKPAGEYKVYGAACAPECTQVREQCVRVKVGVLSKSLIVAGDRYFNSRGQISMPKPYTRLPIEPATAFGGAGFADNPAGKGHAEVANGDCAAVFPLPNVENGTQRILCRGELAAPAGFWGFNGTSPLRQQHMGACDERWIESDWPHLPDDTRSEWFMTAALDQRLPGYFAGDEKFEIEHMHPRHRAQLGALPGLRARCFVNLRTADGDVLGEVKAHAETVWLFPELECGIVLYRALTHCAQSDASDVLHIKAGWESMLTPPLAFKHYWDEFRRETAVQVQRVAVAPVAQGPTTAVAMPDAAPIAEAAPVTAEATGLSAQIDSHLSVVHSLADDLDAQTRALLEEHNLSHADIGPYLKTSDMAPEPAVEISELGKVVEELNAQMRALMDQCTLSDVDIARYMETSETRPAPTFAGVGKMVDELNAQTRALMQQHNLTEEDVLRYMQPGPEASAPVVLFPADESAADAFSALDELVMRAAPNGEASAANMPSFARPEIVCAQAASVPLTRESVIAQQAVSGSFGGYDLSGLNLAGLDLSGADFSGAILEKTSFAGSQLSGADFTRAHLHGADLSHTALQRAQFRKCSAAATIFTKADLRGAQLAGGDFTGADFSASNMADTDLSGAIFDKAKLAGADVSACLAEHACFTDGDLNGAKFNGANLTAASFSGSHFAGTDFSASVCRQVEFYGAQAPRSIFSDSDLTQSRADADTSFEDARFTRSRLERATWEGVQIRRASFERAVLDHADFCRAQAQAVLFGASSAKGACFAKADLSGAVLDGVNLFDGSLHGANLKGALLRHANLYGVDLDGTQPTRVSLEGSNIDRTILTFRPPST
ncbi:uncharacterized protein YjbI with pentapeptide repeats/uncharacterized protein YoxC [Paraburkholderia youngii]